MKRTLVLAVAVLMLATLAPSANAGCCGGLFSRLGSGLFHRRQARAGYSHTYTYQATYTADYQGGACGVSGQAGCAAPAQPFAAPAYPVYSVPMFAPFAAPGCAGGSCPR
jgi:hypothetical protein